MYKPAYTFVLLVLIFGATAAFAGQTAPDQLDTSTAGLKQLVQRVVNNDLNSEKRFHSRKMYLLKKETPRGSQLKEIVETKTISIARLLEIDGKPLTPEQKQAEEDRLNRLANNPDEQRKKQREEKQDDDNATKIFKSLPDAFIYKYEGQSPGNGGEIIHLTFTPDPKWDPPTREVQVLSGMQGTLDIDKQEERITKIEAHLFRDVDFGWGILGRLYKGGSFIVEQSKVGEHRWETTHMVLDITGKALLFKTLIYKEQQYAYDFQSVAQDLSVQDGIHLLHSPLAQNQGSATTSP